MTLRLSFLLLSACFIATSCILITISQTTISLLAISIYLLFLVITLSWISLRMCIKPINELIQHIDVFLLQTIASSQHTRTSSNEIQILRQAVFELITQFQHLKSDLTVTKQTQKQREMELSTIISKSKVNQTSLLTTLNKMEQLSHKAQNISKNIQEIVYKLAKQFSKTVYHIETQHFKTYQSSVSIDKIAEHTQHVTHTMEASLHTSEKSYELFEQHAKDVEDLLTIAEFLRKNTSLFKTQLLFFEKKIHRIKTTIAIICKISEQMNFIALNIAIEAARLHTTGGLFSVLTVELKKLVEQTTAATNNVKKNIESVQTHTRHLITTLDKTTLYSLKNSKLSVKTEKSVVSLLTEIQKIVTLLSSTIKETKEHSGLALTTKKELDSINSITKDSSENIDTIINGLFKISGFIGELDYILHKLTTEYHHTSTNNNTSIIYSITE